MTIVTTTLSMFAALMLRDAAIIATKMLIGIKVRKAKEKYLQELEKKQEKLDDWLKNFKPEEYGDEQHFVLVECNKCEKLRKNTVEEDGKNICLECAINGTE